MATATAPDPPMLSDPVERDRWTCTRERRWLLDGAWRPILERRLEEHLGSVRRMAWGAPDLSANPYRVICEQLATLYLEPPRVRHDAEATDQLDELLGVHGAIARSGLWSMMQRYQSWVIGCREYLMRVDATADGRVSFRPVEPDMVVADSAIDSPHVPSMIRELRLRAHHEKPAEMGWYWDVLDIRDPAAPLYQVRAHGPDGMGLDYSAHYLGGDYSGEAYPYRLADGTPILPYAMHHAEHLGDRLFDYRRGLEMFEGSLTLAVLLSFWLHVFKDASWPQRWGVNVELGGVETVDADGGAARVEVVTDPAVLLQLRSAVEGTQPQVGQFAPGGDPVAMLQAIESYSARVAQDAGVSSSDIQKMSSDPRSGYAISLSNDGKRAAQRRFSSQFREADERMVAIAAVLLNRAAGTAYPESGYSVVYQQIPLSPDELQAREESVFRRLLAVPPLLSRVDAYIELNPGLTAEQARHDLGVIDAERAPTTTTENDHGT